MRSVETRGGRKWVLGGDWVGGGGVSVLRRIQGRKNWEGMVGVYEEGERGLPVSNYPR